MRRVNQHQTIPRDSWLHESCAREDVRVLCTVIADDAACEDEDAGDDATGVQGFLDADKTALRTLRKLLTEAHTRASYAMHD